MNGDTELLIGGRRFRSDSPGFADAVAAAHAGRERPLCMCTQNGVEMYVARLAGTSDSFIVKRMPETGCRHTPDCASYEPPPELSGLGQVLGTAIKEDLATGEIALKLDFPLSRIGGRSAQPVFGAADNSARSDGTRLSLRGLLHYLWDQAELTKWHPGFAGRRSWATVRRHLLQAAEGKLTRDRPLLHKLYVPETFSVEQRSAIEARRLAHWQRATEAFGGRRELLLLLAEVKEIGPARYGHKALVKHLPDLSLRLDDALYRRMERCFERELSLWAARASLHMLMIATVRPNGSPMPAIEELSLMTATAQWVPVDGADELELVERLITEQRCFSKCMRYNAAKTEQLACAVLKDFGQEPVGLFVAPEQSSDGIGGARSVANSSASGAAPWIWHRGYEPMPSLPRSSSTSVQAQSAAIAQRDSSPFMGS